MFCTPDADHNYQIPALALCKALHRLEVRANRLATEYCNGTVEIEALDKYEETVNKRIAELLPNLPIEAFHFNRDPRGYALKINDEWMKANRELTDGLYRDWGGYGILAPEFDGRA